MESPRGQTPREQTARRQAPPLRGTDETNLPTEQQTTETYARLSRPYGYPRRSSGAEASPRQGAQASHRQHSSEATRLTRPIGEQTFPKLKRIRKRGEYLKLQQVGRRRAGKRFVVITVSGRGGGSRLGVTASRRVGGAVVRNRVKRMVREFFRTHYSRIHPPRDVVVIARSGAADADHAEVQRELSAALKIDALE
jgi:ribonuclease P protein component